MNRELIGVDMDEVFFPFVDHFCEDHNARYGTDLRQEHFFSYSFDQVLGIPFEDVVKRVYDFNGQDHGHIPALEAIDDTIARLSDRYDFAIITARHPQFEVQTLTWLEQHVDVEFAHVRHIGHAAVMERPERKVDICKEIGAVALIDDSVQHVRECAEEGLEGILFGDYPWNRDEELPDGVVRCRNWQEVEAYLHARP